MRLWILSFLVATMVTGRRLTSELESRLPRSRLVFKNCNAAFCAKIEEVDRETHAKSTIKHFYSCKDGRGAF